MKFRLSSEIVETSVTALLNEHKKYVPSEIFWIMRRRKKRVHEQE